MRYDLLFLFFEILCENLWRQKYNCQKWNYNVMFCWMQVPGFRKVRMIQDKHWKAKFSVSCPCFDYWKLVTYSLAKKMQTLLGTVHSLNRDRWRQQHNYLQWRCWTRIHHYFVAFLSPSPLLLHFFLIRVYEWVMVWRTWSDVILIWIFNFLWDMNQH